MLTAHETVLYTTLLPNYGNKEGLFLLNFYLIDSAL